MKTKIPTHTQSKSIVYYSRTPELVENAALATVNQHTPKPCTSQFKKDKSTKKFKSNEEGVRMFTKNLDTNKRDHKTEGSNKKEITVNMNDTINVVIRRRISNREESSESLRYKTSFSPIQNNMFFNTNMQVDSIGDDNTQGSK